MTLTLDIGKESGFLYGFPISFLQCTHSLSMLWTHCTCHGIHYELQPLLILLLHGVVSDEYRQQSFW